MRPAGCEFDTLAAQALFYPRALHSSPFHTLLTTLRDGHPGPTPAPLTRGFPLSLLGGDSRAVGVLEPLGHPGEQGVAGSPLILSGHLWAKSWVASASSPWACCLRSQCRPRPRCLHSPEHDGRSLSRGSHASASRQWPRLGGRGLPGVGARGGAGSPPGLSPAHRAIVTRPAALRGQPVHAERKPQVTVVTCQPKIFLESSFGRREWWTIR